MGFDYIRGFNITHKPFSNNHNGHAFQTKDLECVMSEYCIFNGMLYLEVDNSTSETIRHEHAQLFEYTGELSIYTSITEANIEGWVEYDLIFEKGKLTEVISYPTSLIKDHRDLSNVRPNKPSNCVSVSIDVSDCDFNKQVEFSKSMTDEKIEAIRKIIDEPRATVFYPSFSASHPFYQPTTPRMIASVVQTVEDFTQHANGTTAITAPNGDKVMLILDEYSQISRGIK